jgi:phage gpG-like protein
MFAVAVSGADELIARLDDLPERLAVALRAKMEELAATLVDAIKYDKLSGGVLNMRSGALANSIVADVSEAGDAIRATGGAGGDVKYAAIQEYGGKTSAHDILAVKGEALMFMVGGVRRFARKVEHPGSLIPERSYLRSALDEMSGDIVAGLSDAAAESWEAT